MSPWSSWLSRGGLEAVCLLAGEVLAGEVLLVLPSGVLVLDVALPGVVL